jgi:hypothetical protein
VGEHLAGLPGARGSWTAGEIVDLLAAGARPAPDAGTGLASRLRKPTP